MDCHVMQVMPDKQHRLFIAIPLPDSIQASLEGVASRLQKGCQFSHCRPAWVEIQNIHLTLCFLGKTSPDHVRPLRDSLGHVLKNVEAVQLEIKGLGVFPHWKKPKILWAGVRDRGKKLSTLKDSIDQSMAPFGYRPEDREFKPHLTLARIKSFKDVRVLEQQVRSLSPCRLGSMYGDRLNLYRNLLEPTGAVYHILESFPLIPRPETVENS
jgi:2'-5' RNA ligase